MCGVAGFFRRSDEKLYPEEIEMLLLNLQRRGTHATGISWVKNGEILVLKSPLKAEDFIETPVFKKEIKGIADSPWGLLHTRQATHGDPKYNRNNHPIYNNQGLIIHNGMVYPELNLKANGETDSEQILLYIQKYGFKGIKRISGSMSIAYVNFKKMDRFYLYSHLYSLRYTVIPRDIFLFASTDEILKHSVMDFEESKSLPKHRVYRVTERETKSILKVKPKEVIYEKGYKVARKDKLYPLSFPWYEYDTC